MLFRSKEEKEIEKQEKLQKEIEKQEKLQKEIEKQEKLQKEIEKQVKIYNPNSILTISSPSRSEPRQILTDISLTDDEMKTINLLLLLNNCIEEIEYINSIFTRPASSRPSRLAIARPALTRPASALTRPVTNLSKIKEDIIETTNDDEEKIEQIKQKIKEGVKIKELKKVYPQVYENFFYDLKNNRRWVDI